MTDEELVKRLRSCSSDEAMWSIEAADHIEELEAKLAMAVEALQTFKDFDDLPLESKRPDVFEIKVRKPILVALAKLKGEGE
jgi:hypothetical protein